MPPKPAVGLLERIPTVQFRKIHVTLKGNVFGSDVQREIRNT